MIPARPRQSAQLPAVASCSCAGAGAGHQRPHYLNDVEWPRRCGGCRAAARRAFLAPRHQLRPGRGPRPAAAVSRRRSRVWVRAQRDCAAAALWPQHGDTAELCWHSSSSSSLSSVSSVASAAGGRWSEETLGLVSALRAAAALSSVSPQRNTLSIIRCDVQSPDI